MHINQPVSEELISSLDWEGEGEGERGEREGGRRDRVNLTGLFTHSASCRQLILSVIATLLHVRRIANSVPA